MLTLYLTPTAKHWACDIEADGLLDKVTQIWCVTVLNVVTKEERDFRDPLEFLKWQVEFPDAIYVGHNFLAYDAVVLNRLWNARIPVSRIVDTFVLSQLYNPSYPRPKGLASKKGPHSLEAWGLRLNYPKGDYDDFTCYTPAMLHYCRRDTRLTALLFRKLTERMRSVDFSERGVELEHLAWNIIQNKQRRNGFPFDIQKAQALYVELRQREEELKNEIYKLWPPKLEVIRVGKNALKKDGTPSSNYLRACEQYPRTRLLDSGDYECIDYVEFNLGSPAQRIAKLLDLGWVPTKLTKTGNPQVDEDVLLDFAETSDTPEVKALAKWIVVNSRANMVNTWLNAYDEKTKAIHGKLFIASTLRYRHSNPNSANIPAVRTKKVDGNDEIRYGEDGAWTYECRDLWTAGDSDDFVLVGIDGKGIQLRCLAHNVAKMVGVDRAQPFIDAVLAGDPHTNNIKTLGLANKPAAKKFLYTTLMGGGGAKLAVDQAQFGTKLTEADGNRLKKLLIDSVPGFGELIKELKRQLSDGGRIELCDGTPILVPSDHMGIPYLLQGDESRLMKQAMIYVYERIRQNRWESSVLKVADIHDEWQFRVRKEILEDFIAAALPCFVRAGETFGYLIPIEGDAKSGKTWAETH